MYSDIGVAFIHIHTYVHSYMPMYIYRPMYVWLHTYLNLCVQIIMHAHTWLHTYICMFICVAGMSILPFPVEFSCFGRKILHCLISDDVMMDKCSHNLYLYLILLISDTIGALYMELNDMFTVNRVLLF